MDKDRGKGRHTYEGPDSVRIQFTIDKGPEKSRQRVLGVIDSSQTGLALLITDKDFDLLHLLERGDRIRDLALFGSKLKIKEDGIVRHITQVKDGQYKGWHILGVYAPDIAA